MPMSTSAAGQPTNQPSEQPSEQPSVIPSSQPSTNPSGSPSIQPSSQPSSQPTMQPTKQPSYEPTTQPSNLPTAQPSAVPSAQPSYHPGIRPTSQPSSQPTIEPSAQPSAVPSIEPSSTPTLQPTIQPSNTPTYQPSGQPSTVPTAQPQTNPSRQPTVQPSCAPSVQPSNCPSTFPSAQPSVSPTTQPSTEPSIEPTAQPSTCPSNSPTKQPSSGPTAQPSRQPSGRPTSNPTLGSVSPTPSPTATTMPSMPTFKPTLVPTPGLTSPTQKPTLFPSVVPTATRPPTRAPSAPNKWMFTYAGSGLGTSTGDGDHATSAGINRPIALWQDYFGHYLYIIDHGSCRIRVIDTRTGLISAVAGTAGECASAGDGGPATSASFNIPKGIWGDTSYKALYIPEYSGRKVRKINLKVAGGVVATYAGDGSAGYSGDGGPASAAQMLNLAQICGDRNSNIFVADFSANVVRRIDATTEIITTYAGSASSNNVGDGGPASAAALEGPYGLHMDSSSNLFIAESLSNKIRYVSSTTGIITTVVGSGQVGFAGDGSLATLASLNRPSGVWTDRSGNIYVADTLNNRIRLVDSSTKAISTVAGSGSSLFQGDGLLATANGISSPYAVLVDANNQELFYFTDNGNNAVRSISLYLVTGRPSVKPTAAPSNPSVRPSLSPSACPSLTPTLSPSAVPSLAPSAIPSSTSRPTSLNTSQAPSELPTRAPTTPSWQPTREPSTIPPTVNPTLRCPVIPSTPPEYSVPRISHIELVNTETSASSTISSTGVHTNITVAAYLQKDSSVSPQQPTIVYCDAFLSNTKHNGSGIANMTLKTEFDISRRGFSAFVSDDTTSEDRKAEVTIYNVHASTEYVVHCVAVSSQSNRRVSSLPSIQAVNLTVSTPCCKTVFVLLQSTSVRANHMHNDIVTVQLSAEPSSELIIELDPVVLIQNSATGNHSEDANKFYPEKLKFSSAYRLSAAGFQHRFHFEAGSASVQQLQVALSGNSASEYNVQFIHGNYLTVIGDTEEPLTPSLSRAIFSNDGTHLIVYFTSPTNRKSVFETSVFNCSDIFTFRGAHECICSWKDDRVINIFPYQEVRSSSVDKVDVGDLIKLIAGSRLKARCDDTSLTSDCEDWWEVEEQTIKVEGPLSEVLKPHVAIATAKLISPCADITLDLSSSSGHAGRPWTSVQVNVFENGVFCSRSDLQNFLRDSASFSVGFPSNIPRSLLRAGRHYVFQVTMCNFLYICSQGIVDVQVQVNTTDTMLLSAGMYAFGAVERNIRSAAALSFFPVFNLTACDGSYRAPITSQLMGGFDSSSLVVYWTLNKITADTQVPILQLKSESDRESFVLPASLIDIDTQYEVVLECIYGSAAFTYSLYVHAEKSSIIAVLSESVSSSSAVSLTPIGEQVSLLVGSTVTLSASGSYHSFTGSADGLSYDWSCHMIWPTYNDSCAHVLQLESVSDSLIEITALSNLELGYNESIRCRIRLWVHASTEASNGSDSENVSYVSDSAFTDLRIIAAEASSKLVSSPAATLQLSVAGANMFYVSDENDPQLAVVNPVSNIELLAHVVTSSSSETCMLRLDVVDALVSTSSSLLKPADFSGYMTFAISSSTVGQGFFPRNKLTLTLSCLSGASFNNNSSESSSTITALSSSTVTIAINGPPLPGLFDVSPHIGVEMTTVFILRAQFWSDLASDLPLLYQYSTHAAASDDSMLLLVSLSDRSHVATVLPSPQLSSRSGNNTQICELSVFDVHMAVTTTEYEVVVTPLSVNSSLEYINYLIENTDSSSGSSIISSSSIYTADDLYQMISATGTMLDRMIDCSKLSPLVPSCSQLHRFPCSSTPHTCGSCLTGFVGEQGDHNSYCIDPIVEYSNTVDSSSTACATDADCVPMWSTCNTTTATSRRCVPNLKSVYLTCSMYNSGVLFVNTNSGFEVSTCSVSDAYCTALCSCKKGFTGRYCEASEDDPDLLLERAGRGVSLSMLTYLMSIEEASAISVDAWSTTLSQIIQSVHQLSDDSIYTAYNLSISILNKATIIGDSSKSSSTGEASMNAMMRSMDLLFSQQWAGGYDYDVLVPYSHSYISTADHIVRMAVAYADLMRRSSLLPGQAPSQLSLSSFGVHTALVDWSGTDTTVPTSCVFEMPPQPMEQLLVAGGGTTALVLLDLSTDPTEKRRYVRHAERQKQPPTTLISTSSAITSANASASSSIAQVTVVALRGRSFNMETSSKLLSNPLYVQISMDVSSDNLARLSTQDGAAASSALSLPSFDATVTLPRTDPWPQEYFEPNRTYYCSGPDDKSSVTFHCLDSGHVFHHSCSGSSLKRGYYTYRCPRPVIACGELSLTSSSTSNATNPASEYIRPGILINHHCVVDMSVTNSFGTVCRCSFSSEHWIIEPAVTVLSGGNTPSLMTYSARVSITLALVNRYEPYGSNEVSVVNESIPDVNTSVIAASICILCWMLVILLYCNFSVWKKSVFFRQPGHNIVTGQREGSESLLSSYVSGKSSSVVQPINDSLLGPKVLPIANDDNTLNCASATTEVQQQQQKQQHRRDAFPQQQSLGTLMKLYVELLFPTVYQQTVNRQHIMYEILCHHQFFMLFSYNARQYTRWRRFWIIAQMITTQSVLMFVLFAFYDHQDPPDGEEYCKQFDVKRQCLEQSSFLDDQQRFCKWVEYTEFDTPEANHSCVYNPRIFTIKVVMYAIILSSIIAGGIDVPLTKICNAFLISVDESVLFNNICSDKKARKVKPLEHDAVESDSSGHSDDNDSDSSEENEYNTKKRRSSLTASVTKLGRQTTEVLLTKNPLFKQFLSILRSFGIAVDTMDTGLNSRPRWLPERFRLVVSSMKNKFLEEYSLERSGVALSSVTAVDNRSSHTSKLVGSPQAIRIGRGRRKGIQSASDAIDVEGGSSDSAAKRIGENSQQRRGAARRFSFVNITKRRFSMSNPLMMMRNTGSTRIARTKASLDVSNDLLLQLAQQKSRLLLEEDVAEFDRAWGVLNSIYTGNNRGNHVLPTPQFESKTETSVLNLNPVMVHGMANDIRTSTDLSVLWKDCVNTLSEEQQGFAIVYIFLLDLLGRNSLAAQILAEKLDRDFPRIVKRNLWQFVLAGCFIAAMNIIFIGYVLGKGQGRAFSWHKGYVTTLLWLWFLDLFIVRTFECFLVNITIPFLVYRDVTFAKTEMENVLSKIASHTAIDEVKVDVPSYLFVSKKLVKMFPNLVESRIITHYRTYLPGMSSRRWRLVEWIPTTYHTSFDRWVVPVLRVPPYLYKLVKWYGETILALIFFNSFVTRMFFPLLGSALWLLFYQLRGNTAAAASVAIVLFLLLVLVIVRRVRRLYSSWFENTKRMEQERERAAFHGKLLSGINGVSGSASAQRERKRRLVVKGALQSRMGPLVGLMQAAASIDPREDSYSGSDGDSNNNSVNSVSIASNSDSSLKSTGSEIYDHFAQSNIRKVSILALSWSRELRDLHSQLTSLAFNIGELQTELVKLRAEKEQFEAQRAECQASIVNWTSAFEIEHKRVPSVTDKSAIRELYVQYQQLKQRCSLLDNHIVSIAGKIEDTDVEDQKLRCVLQCLDSPAAAYFCSVHVAKTNFVGAVLWRAEVEEMITRKQEIAKDLNMLNEIDMTTSIQENENKRIATKDFIVSWVSQFTDTHDRPPNNADKSAIKEKYVDYKLLSDEYKKLAEEQKDLDQRMEGLKSAEMSLNNSIKRIQTVTPYRSDDIQEDKDFMSFQEINVSTSEELYNININEEWLYSILMLAREIVKTRHQAEKIDKQLSDERNTHLSSAAVEDGDDNARTNAFSITSSSLHVLKSQREELISQAAIQEEELRSVIEDDIASTRVSLIVSVHTAVDVPTDRKADEKDNKRKGNSNGTACEELASSSSSLYDIDATKQRAHSESRLIDDYNANKDIDQPLHLPPLPIYNYSRMDDDSDDSDDSDDDSESERGSIGSDIDVELVRNDFCINGGDFGSDRDSSYTVSDSEEEEEKENVNIGYNTDHYRADSCRTDTSLLSASSNEEEEEEEEQSGTTVDDGDDKSYLDDNDDDHESYPSLPLESSEVLISAQNQTSAIQEVMPNISMNEISCPSLHLPPVTDDDMVLLSPPAIAETLTGTRSVAETEHVTALLLPLEYDQEVGAAVSVSDRNTANDIASLFTTSREEVTGSMSSNALSTTGISLLSSVTAVQHEAAIPLDGSNSKNQLSQRRRSSTKKVRRQSDSRRKKGGHSAECNSDEMLCAVCFDRPADFLVVPCGHQCGCGPCLQKVFSTTRQCPICRNKITAYPVKVYRAGIQGNSRSVPSSPKAAKDVTSGGGIFEPGSLNWTNYTRFLTEMDDIDVDWIFDEEIPPLLFDQGIAQAPQLQEQARQAPDAVPVPVPVPVGEGTSADIAVLPLGADTDIAERADSSVGIAPDDGYRLDETALSHPDQVAAPQQPSYFADISASPAVVNDLERVSEPPLLLLHSATRNSNTPFISGPEIVVGLAAHGAVEVESNRDEMNESIDNFGDIISEQSSSLDGQDSSFDSTISCASVTTIGAATGSGADNGGDDSSSGNSLDEDMDRPDSDDSDNDNDNDSVA